MASTGKTSTKNLIFGLPPPEKRNSTPLANAAERLLFRKIRNLTGTKVQATQDSWRPITADELKQHVADLVLSYGQTLSGVPEVSAEIATKVKQISVNPTEPEPTKVSIPKLYLAINHHFTMLYMRACVYCTLFSVFILLCYTCVHVYCTLLTVFILLCTDTFCGSWL